MPGIQSETLNRTLKGRLELAGFVEGEQLIADVAEQYRILEERAKAVTETLGGDFARAETIRKAAKEAERLGRSLALAGDATLDVNKLQSELNRLGRQLVSVTTSADDYERMVARLNDSAIKGFVAQRNSIDELAESLQAAGTEAERQAARAEVAADLNLDLADRENTKGRRRIDIIGDFDTSFQAIGSGFNAFGARGLGGGTQLIGDVFAVAEGVAQLNIAAQNSREPLRQLVSTIGGGSFASGVGVIGGVTALVAAFALLQRNLKKLEEDINQQFTNFLAGREQVRDLNRSNIAATTLEIARALDAANADLNAARTAYEAQLEALSGVIPTERITSGNRVLDALGNLDANLGRFIVSLSTGSRGLLDTERELVAQRDELQNRLTAALTATSEELQRNAQFQEQYEVAVARGQQARERELAALEARNSLLTDFSLTEIERLRRLEESYRQLGRLLGEVNNLTRLGQQGTLNFINVQNQLNALLEQINALNSLDAIALASENTLFEALRQAEQRRTDAFLESVGRIQRDTEFNNLLGIADAGGFSEAIASRQEEAQVLQEGIARLKERITLETGNLEITDRLNEELERQQQAFAVIGQELTQLQDPQRQLAALGRTFKAFQAELTELEAAFNDVVQGIQDGLTQQLIDLRTTLARTLDGLGRDLTRAFEDAEIGRLRDIEDLNREANRDREDAIREAADKIAQIEADLARKRQQILNRFDAEALNAQARRDAQARFLAAQQRDLELAELEADSDGRIQAERDAQAAQLEEIERGNAEKLATIRIAYQREIEDAQRSNRRRVEDARIANSQQVQDARIAATQRINDARQAFNVEISERRLAYTTQLNDLVGFTTTMTAQFRMMYSNIAMASAANGLFVGAQGMAGALFSPAAGVNPVNVGMNVNVNAPSNQWSAQLTRQVQNAVQNELATTLGMLVGRTIGGFS